MELSTIVLGAITIGAVGVALEGGLEIVRLRKLNTRLRTTVPVDRATGLASRQSYELRAGAEVKRAERCEGSLQVGLWRVRSHDPDDFGLQLRYGLDVTDVGFRLSNDVFAVVTTAIAEDPTACFARASAVGAALADEHSLDYGAVDFGSGLRTVAELTAAAGNQMRHVPLGAGLSA